MTEENKAKYDKVMAAIREMDKSVPTEVANAIDDAFSENDNIEKVSLYTKDNISDLESDLKIKYSATVYSDGKGELHTEDAYTYYGDLIYSQSEYLALSNGDKVIDEIVNINRNDIPTIKNDPDDYAVVLIEVIDSKGGVLSRRTPVLYIYVPVKDDGAEPEEAEDGRSDEPEKDK
jgi:hypothetical protein